MYRETGPAELRPVGETEFVNDVATMSASGTYGKTRICAGIVGHADSTLGNKVEPVLAAIFVPAATASAAFAILPRGMPRPGLKRRASLSEQRRGFYRL
jgi:hypothetical protein